MSDRIERQLSNVECAICCETMRKPVRILPCGHSFCQLCLVDVASPSRHKTTRLKCPICRKNLNLHSQPVEQLPRNFTVENMIDELEAGSSRNLSDDETKPHRVYEAATKQIDPCVLSGRIETNMKEKQFKKALDDFESLLQQVKGKDKIKWLINKMICLFEIKQHTQALSACEELQSSVNLLSVEDFFNDADQHEKTQRQQQAFLDDCDSKFQKLIDKLKTTENIRLALELIFCRFCILRLHHNLRSRLYKLAGLGMSVVVFAQKIGARGGNEIKQFYPAMDEFLSEMHKIQEIDVKEKCKQVAWFLSQYGLCCTAVRDLTKSIEIHKKAIYLMEFVFADDAAQHIVYGHCHCNSGSAYELAKQLDEAKISYEQAVKSYEKVKRWKNEQEQSEKISSAQSYLERVKSKLSQVD